MELHTTKNNGQVFTPPAIVQMMLDHCNYQGCRILKKHIIDNSCGEGAFLCEAVKRYCTIALESGLSLQEVKKDLETYVHGIEILPKTHHSCINNLNKIATSFELEDVQWDIKNEDALSITEYNGQMDYVAGNPPYVRVHNLEEKYNSVKQYSFATEGMTDLYLAFFELGFNMLSPKGKLIYITPSSWLSSLAAKKLREYILQEQLLESVIDFGHQQLFEKATTYVLVSSFNKEQKHNRIHFSTYDAEKNKNILINTLTYTDINIGQSFYFGTQNALQALRKIKEESNEQFVQCKNGFATLADSTFLGTFSFTAYVIPTIKGSTGQWKEAFFPYDKQGKPIPKEELFAHLEISEYLNSHKTKLLKGKSEEENPFWYLYGRSQALKDVWKEKLVVNTLIKDLNSIKLNSCPAGCGVYSGLYILTKVKKELIQALILSKDFIEYISLLRNYKSGGYYTFNTKDLEQYLNHKLSILSKTTNIFPNGQQPILQGYLHFIQ